MLSVRNAIYSKIQPKRNHLLNELISEEPTENSSKTSSGRCCKLLTVSEMFAKTERAKAAKPKRRRAPDALLTASQ